MSGSLARHLIGTASALALALFGAAEVRAAPESVSFASLHRDGTTLKAWLEKPEGAGPFPAIALFHTCDSPVTSRGTIASREASWMKRLVGAGYVVLLVDSFNPRGYRSICNMLNRPITGEDDRPYDAYAALGWLRRQPFVSADRIGMMGWSHGGTTALATVSREMTEKVGWKDAGFVTAVAFYPGCAYLSGTDFRTSVPVLMQLAELDDWTPARYCRRLARRIRTTGGTVEVDTYIGAQHSFDRPTGKLRRRVVRDEDGTHIVHVGPDPAARERSVARVLAWFEERLKY
ncbi:MAG: hypothetical protein RL477_1764 [Pseudomonadota bacterium]|jgi:dienelactone hydrolase